MWQNADPIPEVHVIENNKKLKTKKLNQLTPEEIQEIQDQKNMQQAMDLSIELATIYHETHDEEKEDKILECFARSAKRAQQLKKEFNN